MGAGNMSAEDMKPEDVNDIPGGNEFTEFEQQNIDAARVGISMEQFLATEAGKHLWLRANLEMEEATREMFETSPTDSQKIFDLQLKYRVAYNFKLWISEYITNGEQAAMQLKRAEGMMDD